MGMHIYFPMSLLIFFGLNIKHKDLYIKKKLNSKIIIKISEFINILKMVFLGEFQE